MRELTTERDGTAMTLRYHATIPPNGWDVAQWSISDPVRIGCLEAVNAPRGENHFPVTVLLEGDRVDFFPGEVCQGDRFTFMRTVPFEGMVVAQVSGAPGQQVHFLLRGREVPEVEE